MTNENSDEESKQEILARIWRDTESGVFEKWVDHLDSEVCANARIATNKTHKKLEKESLENLIKIETEGLDFLDWFTPFSVISERAYTIAWKTLSRELSETHYFVCELKLEERKGYDRIQALVLKEFKENISDGNLRQIASVGRKRFNTVYKEEMAKRGQLDVGNYYPEKGDK